MAIFSSAGAPEGAGKMTPAPQVDRSAACAKRGKECEPGKSVQSNQLSRAIHPAEKSAQMACQHDDQNGERFDHQTIRWQQILILPARPPVN